MKKIILTAGLLLTIHVITKAQSLMHANSRAASSITTSLPGRKFIEVRYNFIEDSSNKTVNDFEFYITKSKKQKTAL